MEDSHSQDLIDGMIPENIYTFDNFEKKVIDFKDFIKNLCQIKNCQIRVYLETEEVLSKEHSFEDGNVMQEVIYEVKSKINII